MEELCRHADRAGPLGHPVGVCVTMTQMVSPLTDSQQGKTTHRECSQHSHPDGAISHDSVNNTLAFIERQSRSDYQTCPN